MFYQAWAFVGAGLYRHERHYVTKFLPISLGLFLLGVFLCFFGVLPITLSFLLEFNVWLGIEPTLRLAHEALISRWTRARDQLISDRRALIDG